MGVLGIVLAVIAVLVLLTAVWSARQGSGRRTRERKRDGDPFSRRRNREDLL